MQFYLLLFVFTRVKTKYYICTMKKILLPLTFIILLSSCAIFQKKEKLGCPNDARGKSQEEILSNSNKKKYKGGKKY